MKQQESVLSEKLINNIKNYYINFEKNEETDNLSNKLMESGVSSRHPIIKDIVLYINWVKNL